MDALKKLPLPMLIGVLLTGVWALAVAIFLFRHTTDLAARQVNELADVAGGICAPLAFLWLVVATFLQMDELALQRAELKESREAQQKQAKETEALVVQTGAAAEVARQTLEAQQRKETEARLNELIDLLAEQIALRSNDILIGMNENSNHERFFGKAPDKTDIAEVYRIAMQTSMALSDGRRNTGTHPVNKAIFIFEVTDVVRTLRLIQAEADAQQFPVLTARIRMLGLAGFELMLSEILDWARSR